MNGSDWRLIVSTIDWVLIGLYVLIGILLLIAKPKTGGGKFRLFTAVFCIHLSIVYILILLIARQELATLGPLSVFLILSPSLLPLSWMLLVESLFEYNLRFEKRHWVFLLPFIAETIYILYLILLQGESMTDVADQVQNLKTGFLQSVISMNQVLFAWSFFLITRMYNSIKKELFILFPESIFMRWIKTWGLVIMISAIVFHTTTFIDFKPTNLFFVPMIMIHFFVWILITFMKYPELFTDFYVSKKAQIEKKNDQNNIDHQRLHDLVVNLDQLVSNEKLFLSPDIDVQTVAGKLGIKIYELSAVLSQIKLTNFNQYINQFRIEELINQLENGVQANITIEALGQEVGFKSKSSFYTAFKKHTGHTPSEYIKKLKK